MCRALAAPVDRRQIRLGQCIGRAVIGFISLTLLLFLLFSLFANSFWRFS
jgi:hypothetical protein